MEGLAQEVAQEVSVAEHCGVATYTDLTVVALVCIAGLAEIEYEHHRVVHIAGVVQADYSNHDGELVPQWCELLIKLVLVKLNIGWVNVSLRTEVHYSVH